MKKLFYALVAVMLSAMVANSQVLEKGDNAINVGIGVPSPHNFGGFGWPSISASYEHGFSEKVGIGYISGGAIVALSGSRDEYTNWGYTATYTYTHFIVGPRAAYHFDFYDMTNNSTFNQFDIYAGVFAGMRITSYSYKEEWDNGKTVTEIDNDFDEGFGFEPEIFIGARYYTNSAFGFYLEAGHGVSYLSGGVTFRF